MNICFVTIGIPSALSAINAAVDRLAPDGVTSHVLSGRKSAARMVSRHSRFAQFDQLTATQYPDEHGTDSVKAPPSLVNLLEKLAPDLVLVDSEMHSEQLYAEAAGFCVAALEYHVSPDRVRAIPPLSSSFIPEDSLRDRVRCYRIWRQLHRHRKNRPELQAYFQSLTGICDSLSRDYRALADHGHWQPVRFRHIPIVRLAPLALDFLHVEQSTERFYSAGAVDVVDGHDNDSFDRQSGLSDWISHRPRRLVVCTAGSLIHDTRFIDSFIELARRRDDLDFLIGGITTESAPVLPVNVRAAQFIPQRFALRYADFMLSGAGIATVIEAVEHGVPLLVVSHGVLDQNGNAARVVHHGIGRRIANKDISADRLAQDLTHLDDSVRARIEHLRQRLRAENDGNNLMAHCRQLVAAGPSSSVNQA